MSAAQPQPADNPFVAFLDRYASDPVLFVREVLGGDPDEKQSAVLMAIARGERHISIRSGHGVGKTTTLAWAIIWWMTTRFPQKTLCTAPTSAQLFDALLSETKAWITKLPAPVQALFEVKSDRIELIAAPDESFASFKTSRAETPEALAGSHSANMLIIADEASGVPDVVFEAAMGSMSGENAVTILAGNPVRREGHFYETHTSLSDFWLTFHISCEGHPRITPKFIAEAERKYGRDSNAFRVRVLGEFPLADDDVLIPFYLAEAALTRDVEPLDVLEIWGVDCARFGSDKSALARRKGNVLVEPVIEWDGLDTMQVVGRVHDKWNTTLPHLRPSEILVDTIGIGAGVCDRLIELGLPARGINVSESPAMKERFINLRSELWWEGREWLAKLDCSLAGDKSLAAELCRPKYDFTSNGKLQVESKKEMKKRGIPSPNKADAFLLTLASNAVSAAWGSKGSVNWKQPLTRKIKGLA